MNNERVLEMGGLWDVWFDDDAAVVTATYKSFKFIVIGCYNFPLGVYM